LAASLAGKVGQEPETGPSFFVLASPDLIWSESQIISGAAGDELADLSRAVNILESRLKKAEEEHNVWRIIYIRANMALAFETMGRSAEAQSALEHSLRLALPGGYIRPFVDQGRSMANLLAKLGAKNSELKVYVAKLLTAYELTLGVTQATPAPEALVDPLTGRELEVLTLLDKRLSNKEIAAQLTISVGTVKQYTSRIYKKLNVHNRRQAVIHAYEVGILRIQ
jgi:LuxR family maltose regulon positive regulatory protein